MVLRIGNSIAGRCGTTAEPAGALPISVPASKVVARRRGHRSVSRAMGNVLSWMIRGYQQVNAGDLAAAVAFHALVALIPTFLLFLSVAGLFLHVNQVLITSIYASIWGLPGSAAEDALGAVLTTRNSSSWLGVLSLAGFAWTGTGFIGCLARSMNRIYGVPGCGYMCEKRRGFFVILAFAALFIAALLSSTVPTLFVGRDLPVYFRSWALAAGRYQVLGYVVAFLATVTLFGMLYRVIPNAGQRLSDIWPGTMTAATLFLIMAQAFPLYLSAIGGANRYGAVFGLVSLLVAWFLVLAHVLLFGAYVNATYQRRQRRRFSRRAVTHGRQDTEPPLSSQVTRA
ncbi:MAG: YihY/virulence factor BrkB family protein [Thermomicrobiales bacterium]